MFGRDQSEQARAGADIENAPPSLWLVVDCSRNGAVIAAIAFTVGHHV